MTGEIIEIESLSQGKIFQDSSRGQKDNILLLAD
jgi:hypothetical protein